MVLGLVLGLVSYHGWIALPSLEKMATDQRLESGFEDISLRKAVILSALNENKESIQWIFTDEPIYAFLVSKPVPPEIATWSEKMYFTGILNDEMLEKIFDNYQPEAVLIGRYELAWLITKIEKLGYEPIYVDRDLKLYFAPSVTQP